MLSRRGAGKHVSRSSRKSAHHPVHPLQTDTKAGTRAGPGSVGPQPPPGRADTGGSILLAPGGTVVSAAPRDSPADGALPSGECPGNPGGRSSHPHPIWNLPAAAPVPRRPPGICLVAHRGGGTGAAGGLAHGPLCCDFHPAGNHRPCPSWISAPDLGPAGGGPARGAPPWPNGILYA